MTLAVIGIKVTMTVRITESGFQTFYLILFSDGDDEDDDDDDDDDYDDDDYRMVMSSLNQKAHQKTVI